MLLDKLLESKDCLLANAIGDLCSPPHVLHLKNTVILPSFGKILWS